MIAILVCAVFVLIITIVVGKVFFHAGVRVALQDPALVLATCVVGLGELKLISLQEMNAYKAGLLRDEEKVELIKRYMNAVNK